MDTIMQPFFLTAFGDPLGKTPYVGQSSTAKRRDFEFHLQQMEKGEHDTGYQKAVSFGFEHTPEQIEKKRRHFWDEFWRMLLLRVYAFDTLYDFAMHSLQAAEEALETVHEQIADEIENIKTFEEKLEDRMEKYGSTSVLRRLKRRLARERLELEDQHDELHDYESEVLEPAREGLTNKKKIDYKKLFKIVTDLAAVTPALLMSPFLRYLARRELTKTMDEAEKQTASPHYSEEWNRASAFSEPEEEPEPVY